MAELVILGVDPGHKKVGLGIVAGEGRVLLRRVALAAALEQELQGLLATHPVSHIVLGNGTRSREVFELLTRLAGGAQTALRDETGTSLAARARYWHENPPRGLWRLWPTSMRVPPEPIDDWVAVLLAERYAAELRGG